MKEKRKPIKVYARISNDELQNIIDFDENLKELAKRWNTKPNVILSSISHHQKLWERIVMEE